MAGLPTDDDVENIDPNNEKTTSPIESERFFPGSKDGAAAVRVGSERDGDIPGSDKRSAG